MNDERNEERGPATGPRFFGRRRGKRLRRHALGLLETLLPRLAIALPAAGETLPDPRTLFPRPVDQVWLEIGFGGGEHVVAQARLHPEIGLIGCEPFRNGVASLLAHLLGSEIDTVRILADDVRLLLPHLPEGSIGRAFVLFPDPWPKARHAERRFVGPENLDALARVLADGAELRVASDDPVYQEWATRQLRSHPAFTEVVTTTDRSRLPPDWPATRYELKCLAGRPAVFFLFRRKAR
ncbi:MAG: tRNA (guanosine(46)-N7)-methyltransferase TrmB [Magnetospirillum sp.]|nr:tRNA (guanosine(46)-N7)-methyltransferase TrmB [Magnetospirillum sp.]